MTRVRRDVRAAPVDESHKRAARHAERDARGSADKQASPPAGSSRPLGTRAGRPADKRPACASPGRSERRRLLRRAPALVEPRALSAVRLGGDPMTVSAAFDVAARRRSPATMPGYHAGRVPRNKGQLYPADPPTVGEIIAVMRQTADDRHGARLRALIVVLWRSGLRLQEALSLGERDLDARRGSLLVRSGKGGRRREIGMDPWTGSSCGAGSTPALSYRSGRCSASSTDQREAGHGRPPASGSSSVGSPPRRACGGGSRRTSCATPTRSSSPAKACRSTAAARPRQPRHDLDLSPRGSTPKRSSPPCTPGARR